MEQEIRDLIKKHYKRAVVRDVDADLDDTIALNVSGVKYEYLAKRLLDKFKEIYWVRFDGGFQTWIFSRETLKWMGYGKNKLQRT